MVENEYSLKVSALISQFRQTLLSERKDPETFKDAWRTYLQIKENNVKPERSNPEELKNIRKTIEVMEKGGLPEHNHETFVAYYALRVDLGMFGTRGIIGKLKEEDKKKVSTFARGMLNVLVGEG
jgi:hypothetical protein